MPKSALKRVQRRPLSLIEVAERLRDESVDRVVDAFRERRVAIRRTVLLAILALWTVFWARPNAPSFGSLHAEAVVELPMVLAFLVISIVWTVAVKRNWVPQDQRIELAGSAANFLGQWALLHWGFFLMTPIVALLPQMSIAVGALFTRRAFFASIVASMVILASAAPPGYWDTRPVVALFAILLVAGLPMTVNRVLNGLRAVSEQAILSRDARSRFIATMSHELRTPLNTVINAAALIDTKNLDGADQHLMRSLASNANALLTRVNDVLDVAAIDGGRLHLAQDPFIISDVLKSVQDVLGSRAEDKGITLRFDNDVADSDVLIGDAGRIEQVLSNLAANAVKFTPAGGSVTVSVASKPSNNKSTVGLAFTVRDTGIGIADKDKKKIFEPFSQVSMGAARQHDGVGLGLHIVRTVSERLNGRIAVEDNPDGGTVFTWLVELPRAAAGQTVVKRTTALAAIDTHRARVPSMRCLIVEDNVPNRDIIARVLGRSGHTLQFADDGQKGLAAIRAGGVDVAFLDLHMPGMTGWQVLEEVAKSPGIANAPPIVVLSAVTDPESLEHAKSLGAVAYVAKPIQVHLVLDVLQDLAIRAQLRAVAEPVAKPTDVGEASPLDMMRQLGNPSAVREYLETCVAGIRQNMVSLVDAISAGNTAAAADYAHALKNDFANLRYLPGIDACQAFSAALNAGQPLQAELSLLDTQASLAVLAIQREPELMSDVHTNEQQPRA